MLKKKNKIGKTKKRIFTTIIIFVVILAGYLWMASSYDYAEVAESALKNSENVFVEDGEYIAFTPNNSNNKGFIFYPGAKVEPEAYAPLCRQISEEGYTVVIVPMPLNFAIFDSDKAKEVIEKYPEIESWAIGGHSLGGVMASKYAAEDEKIEGVVLYASYPQGDELQETGKRY